MMTYTVVIMQDGETARLECATLQEAQLVRQSFINYGKCQEVIIKEEEEEDNRYAYTLSCMESDD